MKEEILPIFLDFDGTLSDTKRIGDEFQMGEPIPYMVEAANEASKEREIVIFTARPVMEWEEVRTWLIEHNVNYSGITNVKRPAKHYVDDRSLKPEEFASIYAKKR
jgi:hypothetical protein